MMASNNSDRARYTYRNMSPDFKHVYKRLYKRLLMFIGECLGTHHFKPNLNRC